MSNTPCVGNSCRIQTSDKPLFCPITPLPPNLKGVERSDQLTSVDIAVAWNPDVALGEGKYRLRCSQPVNRDAKSINGCYLMGFQVEWSDAPETFTSACVEIGGERYSCARTLTHSGGDGDIYDIDFVRNDTSAVQNNNYLWIPTWNMMFQHISQ